MTVIINVMCGRVYRNSYKTDIDNLRNTNDWHKKAEEIKEKASYLCEVCKDNNIYNYNNLEVHHIIKLRNNSNLLLDNNNLICLCWKHHRLADKGNIKIEYLQKLAATREG